ncbi:hypothetical protein [Actinoplanes sp. NPDC051851]|uniref:hypothetical protein n=1 Tax=Actinoplanes sp. NPDC051851 TaxID=3154753 RepID=UPI0034452FFB
MPSSSASRSRSASYRIRASPSTPAANVFPFLIGAAFLTGYRVAPSPEARRLMRLSVSTFGFGATLYMLLGRIPK